MGGRPSELTDHRPPEGRPVPRKRLVGGISDADGERYGSPAEQGAHHRHWHLEPDVDHAAKVACRRSDDEGRRSAVLVTKPKEGARSERKRSTKCGALSFKRGSRTVPELRQTQKVSALSSIAPASMMSCIADALQCRHHPRSDSTDDQRWETECALGNICLREPARLAVTTKGQWSRSEGGATRNERASWDIYHGQAI